VFLFDEPLSNLDAALRGEMRREIAALHRRLAATMLYVTHDQIEAMTLGDRIVVMNRGHIVQVGAPNDVYLHPRDTFVASFVGSPPMNLLQATVMSEGGVMSVRIAGAEQSVVPLPASLSSAVEAKGITEVIVGLRPEDIQATPANEGDATGSLSGVVELVEQLGHQQLLHLRAGTVPVTVRSEGRERPPLGAAMALRIDPARIHLFDAATTQAI
jgi:multiple sugar transport system ATP-binding protein